MQAYICVKTFSCFDHVVTHGLHACIKKLHESAGQYLKSYISATQLAGLNV